MKESLVYLKILKYIKSNGIQEFKQLFNDLEHFNLKEENIIEDLIIFNKAKELNNLMSKNIKLLKFFRDLQCKNVNFLSKEFRYFIKMVELNMDKINIYIENARKLVELGIDTIDFVNLGKHSFIKDSEIYYDCSSNIIKQYNNETNEIIYFKTGKIIANRVIFTDGKLNLTSVNNFNGKGTKENPFNNYRIDNGEVYKLQVKDASFILESENHENNMHFKYIIIPNFEFRADKLPSKEEIESYTEPEYIKQYKKTFK